jgi:flagellar biosynthesis/type III secretory pathway M-ring protein FliF/YscJ
MDFLNRAYSQLADLFRSMTPGARLMAGLSAAAVLLSIGYLTTHQAVLPEVDLMHGLPLSSGQLPAMQAAFSKAKLKGYEIRGTSIFVPHGQEADYMAALAAADALPPNVGDAEHKAVNDSTMFEFGPQRDQRMRIAKQEELARNIRQMTGIATASVLFDVDSRPGPFKEKVITASVMVTPTETGHLDKQIVSAIRNMVARSIAGLKPEDIAVTDLIARRTWSSNLEDTADDANQLHRTLKRSYEQDLTAKVLGALCYIPRVTVAANVELSQDQASRMEQPVLARVSVGVPMSYFREIWQRQNPSEWSVQARTVDPAALERIRTEETAKIQHYVAQLLPTVKGSADATERVTVNTFQDVRAEEPLSGVIQEMIDWARQSWRLLGAFVLALVSLLVLRSMFRQHPQDAKIDSAKSERVDEMVGGGPSVVPAPHAERFFQEPGTSLREELSKLIEDDPDSAANVLRSWIGQVN